MIILADHFLQESSNADDRTLHEIYLWPFARAVEAGVGAIMCSYNRINETYACQNNDTLTTILKGELGFRGFVMSDWGATMSGAPSILAGLDMDMPGGDGNWGSNMVSNVNAGTVPLSRAQDAATRIAAAYYKMGQQSGFPTAAINSNNPSAAPYVNVQADHSTLIRQIGAASAILLKNQGNILPLKTPATLGVIGGDAADSAGDYGAQGCQVLSCDNGTLAMGWGSGGSYLPYLINPLQGIKTRAPTGTKVISSLDVWDYNHAAQVAATVDIAIVFGNADSGEGIDRNNLSLWYNADALITAVATANPNTIAVIHAAGPVLMPWINLVKGVIYAGLPGQETGNSLADVLWGDVNPSGRLPYTLAKATADYPAHVSSASDISYSEGLLMGYRYFDAKNVAPLYEFGFGLSYTTFAYSGLGVTSNNANVTVSITIQNNGSVSGAEVPQLYIGFPASAGEPPKVLRGFEKVTIAAGAKTTVSFVVSIAKELSIWDSPSSSWIVPSGTFTAYVGASSRDIRQQTTFTVTGGGNSGGWTYLGCYVDTLSPRALPYAAASVGTGMTIEACESECLAASYKFAGVEYGNECWCGNTQPATAATATDCNMACAGKSSETCGAGSRLNVYSYGTSTSTTTSSTTTTTATKTTTSKTTSSTTTTKTTTTATATPTSGWKYLGCYVDALSPRTLPYGAPAVSSGMTVEACESECLVANYAFAGVEYGNECWCGNTMPPTAATASDCSMACAGNAAEMCGAGGRFNLYQHS
jgi:beta-glucosidase